MQKDTIIHQISTVMLDPEGGNARKVLAGINEVSVIGYFYANDKDEKSVVR